MKKFSKQKLKHTFVNRETVQQSDKPLPEEVQMEYKIPGLMRELVKLSCGSVNYDKFDGYGISDVEHEMTDFVYEEEKEAEPMMGSFEDFEYDEPVDQVEVQGQMTERLLGFSISEAEARQAEEKFEADLIYAREHYKSNKALYSKKFDKVDFDKVDSETLIDACMSVLDDQSCGYGTVKYPAEAKIRVEEYYDGFDAWHAAKKADFFGHYKFINKRYPVPAKLFTGRVDEDGKPILKNNPLEFTLPVEDVFEMDDAGFPVALKTDTARECHLVRNEDGIFTGEKEYKEVTTDCITAFLLSYGVPVNSAYFRFKVFCPTLGEMTELNFNGNYKVLPTHEYKFKAFIDPKTGKARKGKFRTQVRKEAKIVATTFDERVTFESYNDNNGVLIQQGKYDIEEYVKMRKRDNSEILYGRCGQLHSSVASVEAAWKARQEQIAEERKMDIYANRKAVGAKAKAKRIEKYYQDIIDNNPVEVSLVKMMLELSDAEAIDSIKLCESPRLLLKVARAIGRVTGDRLPRAVWKALSKTKEEKSTVQSSQIIDALNNDGTKMKVLNEIKELPEQERIVLINDVLDTAKANLAKYTKDKKKGNNPNRKEYGMINDYNVFKLLDKLSKQFGKTA